MSVHDLIVVGTNKAHALGFLWPDPAVHLITEPWYESDYRGLGVQSISVVPDVRDVEAVRRAADSVISSSPRLRVLAPSERSVLAAGFLRTCYGLEGTGFETSVNFTSKPIMARKFAEAGVPVAGNAWVTTAPALVDEVSRRGHDVVIKPAMGTGNAGVLRISGGEQLQTYAESISVPPPGGWLVQDRVAVEHEFHLDALVVNHQLCGPVVSQYFEPCLNWTTGTFFGSFVLDEANPTALDIISLGNRAVRALGLRSGVVHLEVFQDRYGLICNEIACRPGGDGVTLSVSATRGRDFWTDVIALERGWSSDHSSSIFPGYGWVALPRGSGRVRSISDRRELEGIDGVVAVDLTVREGDIMRRSNGGYAAAGFCLVQSRDDLPMERIREQIRAQFILEADPVA
ncbi:hypothetical protein ACFRJ9_11135 [Paenarthrobacter sp. NPDC056912]|uniref:hypothetical protein n=1 Tax=Paenarthrobacter sp. NPDC056912 TaxID=3345965 RepID=UPI00366F91A3